MAITNQDEFNQTVSTALRLLWYRFAGDLEDDDHRRMMVALDVLEDYAFRDEPVVLHAGP